jgi:hypothetical protein
MAATVGKAFIVTVVVTLAVQPPALVTVYVIVAVPLATPVTLPLASMVATAVLLEDQVPLGVASLNMVVAFWQRVVVPVMGWTVGRALTVMLVVTLVEQPLAFVTVYVIMAVPLAMPVTLPVASIVAIAVLPEDQVPPVVTSARAVLDPTQTVVVPVMDWTVGRAFTVTLVVTLVEQPLAFVTVYVMVAEPAVMPVTLPVASMVATAVLLEDQVPPTVTSARVVVDPAQTLVLPVIG